MTSEENGMEQKIKFKVDGKILEGYIVGRMDSDPRASVIVTEAKNPDVAIHINRKDIVS
jgi:hypothetical protein